MEGNICINTNNSTVPPSHIVTQGNQKKRKEKEQNSQTKETMLSSKDYITQTPCTLFLNINRRQCQQESSSKAVDHIHAQ